MQCSFPPSLRKSRLPPSNHYTGTKINSVRISPSQSILTEPPFFPCIHDLGAACLMWCLGVMPVAFPLRHNPDVHATRFAPVSRLVITLPKPRPQQLSMSCSHHYYYYLSTRAVQPAKPASCHPGGIPAARRAPSTLAAPALCETSPDTFSPCRVIKHLQN